MRKRNLVIIILVLVVSILSLFFLNKERIVTARQNLRAFSRGAIMLGNFSINNISVKCVSVLPQVSLNWSQSKWANSYSIERMYPWGGDWESTGATSNFLFTDATYEPDYDIGYFSYRIKASNEFGTIKYSNIKKIYINECVAPPVIQKPTDTTPPPTTSKVLQWGAYVGDGENNLATFESLVGKKVNLYADFEGWNNLFPSALSTKVGAQGKTLVIFWEPEFGYDPIINGSEDTYIKQFAQNAKAYNYPIILAPFDEMNLNEEAWGYGLNNNTPTKFITAWKHIHDLFVSEKATNVKFAITYNNVSVPDIVGNRMKDYYPGSSYVDYIGVTGFNFGNPWQTFAQVFDGAINQANIFSKPIYIISTGSEAGIQKAAWITQGLGTTIKKYTNVIGFIWFNQGGSPNWIVNSDSASLSAFKSVLP